MRVVSRRGPLAAILLALSLCVWGSRAFAHPFDPFAEDKQAALALVLEHLRGGETNEALLQVEDAIRKFPRHGPFYTLKAQILLKANRAAEAGPVVERGIQLSPDYSLGYWVRGLVRQHQHDAAGALADFEHVVAHEEENAALKAQAVGSRGMVLVDLGRYGEAMGDLDRAIEARPNAFAERQFRATALLALNRLEQAERDIRALLEMNAKDGLSQRLYGELLLRRGAGKPALVALDNAVQLNPRDALAYRLRAQAHLALKQTAAAQTDLALACKGGDQTACETKDKRK